MKDVSELGTQYFDIPSKEVANHIQKWLATLNFRNYGSTDWNDKDARIFFTSSRNEYLFTNTPDDHNWEELYKYGMPEYLGNQISTPKITLTEDNIRDFYFEVNNQTEADDAIEILEKASEVIYQKGFTFLTDSWRYISYFNSHGWRLSDESIGNKSNYQELLNLYEPKETIQLHSNVNINGKLPDDRITYVNEIVDACICLFQVGDSFLDLVHKKKSKIIAYNYTYYVEQDKLYVSVSNDRNDKTQCIYSEGKWANKIEESKVMDLLTEAKNRYPIGTKFRPAHIDNKSGNYCLITTENFRIDDDKTIYAKLINNDIYERSPYKHGNTDYNRCVYYNSKWAEILEDELPNSATSSKKITELRYPDVVHIETKEDHAKLKKFHSNITDWKDSHHYYLIGQGYAEKRKSYENAEYTIYEMDQIIMDTPVKEIETPNMDIFPGIKIGDIVVSLVKKDGYREVGDMFKVLPESSKACLYYRNAVNSSKSDTFRLATYQENVEYARGVRNVNINLHKVESILERANRMYPIGTKVKLLAGTDGVDAEGIIQKEFILYDNGSVSYKCLPGYVYCSKTNEWAKIVKDNIEIGDYVTVISSISYASNAQKLIGKTFKVTKKCPIDSFKSKFYVCGAEHQYPYLFPLPEGGIYEEVIRLATQDEINNLEYKPGPIVDTDVKAMYGETLNGIKIGVGISSPYDAVTLTYISQNDTDLKCKTSQQYINTTIASIPTINKELKQKKQKFYF